ncbi:hypothetical protein Bca52824_035781 [Brassica carinata]|uniref:Uncharacterized protein n=1 Tax=Brassica carinata TaxID=52824 RepID=A0A8X7V214_BRACI|nr:hypothetical protein Bca52824_035781 [Brassica carinata]
MLNIVFDVFFVGSDGMVTFFLQAIKSLNVNTLHGKPIRLNKDEDEKIGYDSIASNPKMSNMPLWRGKRIYTTIYNSEFVSRRDETKERIRASMKQFWAARSTTKRLKGSLTSFWSENIDEAAMEE